jgi:hypothetical protein
MGFEVVVGGYDEIVPKARLLADGFLGVVESEVVTARIVL